VAKCRIDSFRLRGTGSMRHMFLLNIEFGNRNACRFRFSTVTFRPSRVFHSRVFSRPSVDTDENVVTNFSCWQCLCTLLFRYFISSYYCTCTLLKSFTVPSALLAKFAKKFHTKLLVSAFIFTKLSTKTLCFDAAVFHLSMKGYAETRPHRSYCFLSMFKLQCKRHYRNLATYSFCTTWREHVTKTAPERRRHSAGGGGGAQL